MKKIGYIVLGILVLGSFGLLGYFVGEGVKSDVDADTFEPYLQNKPTTVAKDNGIKING